jgi:hypothetical protein
METKMPKRTIVETTYQTPDLGLAAYLQTMGRTLKEVKRVSDRRVEFVFEDQATCKAAALSWHNEQDVPVRASTYARTLSRLKALAHRGSV